MTGLQKSLRRLWDQSILTLPGFSSSLGLGRLAKHDPEKAEEFFKLVKSKDALVELALIRGRPRRPGSCWTA